ncbi:hypothetical protein AX17_004700 [Amanita inopinata Kibby_2008]|nr:hypothetical protein AX17_004700 [Amanita inopinata Kibby_2008]
MSLHGSPSADISAWRSVRPWAPPLSLIVREVSSVTATFILSFAVADVNRDIASLIASADEENDNEADNDDDNGNKDSKKRFSYISRILAKGLFSVNVNGSPWQRLFIRVADSADEAVIIIYGLLPGRQYEIDLGLVQDGRSNTIRSRFTTEDHDHHRASDTRTEPERTSFEDATPSPVSDQSPSGSSHSPSSSTSSSSAFATDSETSQTSQNGCAPSNSASTSSVSTAPNGAGTVTSIEEQLNQLQQNLNTLIAERDMLTTNLKSVRRESQKADATLRAEIEVLKRASEKNAASEQRARQKILALQEAYKRAVAATKETEEQVREVEALLPELLRKKEEKEKTYQKKEVEADKMRKERERIEETERKKVEGMKTELAGLDHKLEKLTGKREKLENGTIPDLEEQLKEVADEIRKIEEEERDLERALASGANGSLYNNQMPVDEMGVLQHPSQSTPDTLAQQPQQQRMRHHSFHGGPPPGLIGRQSIPVTQRPTELHTSVTHPHVNQQSQQLWNTAPSRLPQTPRQQNNTRTLSYPQFNSLPPTRSQPQLTPTILTNPQRKPSLFKSTTVASPVNNQLHYSPPNPLSSSISHGTTSSSSATFGNASPTTSSPNLGLSTSTSAPAPSSSSASSSTLSTRAPAFEPGRGLGLGLLPKVGTNAGTIPNRLGHAAPVPIGTSSACTNLRTAGESITGRSQ